MTHQIVSRGVRPARQRVRPARRACSVSAAIVALAQVHAQAQAQAQSDPVVAKVNGVEIRESDLAMAEEDIGQQAASSSTGDGQARRIWSPTSPT